MSLQHSPKIVTDGLILLLDAANYRSYPGNGTEWFDLSNSKYHSTIKGTTTFVQNSLDLGFVSNITNYIQVPTELLRGISDFTISLWVNAASITNGELNTLFHATNTGGNDFSVEWYSTYVQTLIVTTYSTFNYTAANNTWYNFVFYRTGTSMGLYLNGSDQGAVSCPSTILNITGAIVLGQEQDLVGGGFQAIQSFKGKYATVSFYNRALSSTEIIQNFNSLRGRYGL